ncbi:hypothetical protein [Planomicrobium sp. CPCC 101110]|uniref:hypothetical protein n=1 Tax=Planomicrobium sp. CPCC 101110 TaxID=2599619 RepID=UPI0011B46508|nr:hypothetical protein [Planomicrobium sp. CPCC 101110]TWT25858.1 hypothetical protein FQV30_08660 [Planomicrobium sp. CPCC 101110]
MKLKMNRKDLLTNDDIWNAVITVISEKDFPFESKRVNETWVVYHYYSELESGGHEMLLHWLGDYIKEVGIQQYQKELINILEKIGAADYAVVEMTYLEQLWQLYQALEENEIEEEKFYSKIESADSAYYAQDGKLGTLLESYFIEIHTDLINIVED